MDLDDQFRRYFGTSDLDTLTPAAMAGGIEHMRVELGLETDPGRRFALWSILHMLGSAPDLDVAFKNPAERDAARNFMDMLDRAATQAMTTPYAVIMHKNGGPDVLSVEPFEPAKPGPGQVLVRQTAIGLNFIDTYVRSGLYPGSLPSGLGGEAAGVVAAVGEGADTFKIGDRVGYCTLGPGSYATHRLADQDKLVPIPDGITDEQAAAALLKGCTAEYLIERCAKVEPGQWVLVHAAAGGVGTILVQWLKAIGARVIAHAGTAQKAALATDLGADHALSCPMPDLGEAVKALTGGAGVPVVLDGVGAASWTASLASVARRGLIVSYGNASGAVPAFTMLDLMRQGSVFTTRPTLGDYCHTAPELRASAARMFSMIASGAVALRIDQRFKLADAADAHRALESRATTGASVLIP